MEFEYEGSLKILVDGGVVLETQSNDQGSWGAVIAATLTHSGIFPRLAMVLGRKIPFNRGYEEVPGSMQWRARTRNKTNFQMRHSCG